MTAFSRMAGLGLLLVQVPVQANLGAAAVAQSPATSGFTPAEQSLLRAETSRFNAQLAGALPALRDGIAQEARYIHQAGLLQTKDQYLQGMEPGKSQYKKLDATEREAQVYGAIGVTHGILNQDAGPGKQSITRYTGVYVKRQHHWQLLSWQTTVIAPAKY